MTRRQKQLIVDEVHYYRMDADPKVYAYIQDGEVVFLYFPPLRSVVREYAVVKYGEIVQVVRHKKKGTKT